MLVMTPARSQAYLGLRQHPKHRLLHSARSRSISEVSGKIEAAARARLLAPFDGDEILPSMLLLMIFSPLHSEIGIE